MEGDIAITIMVCVCVMRAFDLFSVHLEHGGGLLVELAGVCGAPEARHHDQEGPPSCSTHPRNLHLDGADQRTRAALSACVVAVVHPVREGFRRLPFCPLWREVVPSEDAHVGLRPAHL